MKVALFINTFQRGGAERLVLDLAIELTQIDDIEPVIIAADVDGDLGDEFKKADIEIRPLNIDVSLANIPIGIVRFYKAVSNGDIDVLHSHLPFSHIVSRVVCTWIDIPHIATYHNVSQHKSNLKWLVEVATGRLSKRVICVSEGVRQSYPNSKKMEVIYNGLDVEKFNTDVSKIDRSDLEVSIPENTLILLNVARCVEQKQQQDLVEAFKLLNQEDIHLFLVGDGPKREFLEKKVKRYGLSDKITVTGFVEAVEPYYSIADVFISSSKSEGLPTTHIEAMAAKLPIISTDIPGVSEIVKPKVTGYLCPVNSPSELATAIEKIQGANIESIGQKGYEYAIDKFTIQKMAEEHAVIYKKITQG